jgi:HD-GYP domain-containing protein (c-di-GMP phosphodiesterase class II)
MHLLDPALKGARDARRLDLIVRADLADGAADESLDRLTRIAATAVRAPVSLVTVIGADAQFVPGAAGLGEPWASSRRTPLSHSFCRHVLGGRPLVVEDATADPVVRHNPAIEDLGVVAYAGVPLRVGHTNVVGALCAIDHRPRSWSSHDMTLLAEMAPAAAAAIERRIAPSASLPAVGAGVAVLRRVIAARDPGTGRHCDRVGVMAVRIAAVLGWPSDRRARLYDAAVVHDVGKVGVPDAVLFHPGRLDAGAFAIVRRHASLGARIVAGALDPEQVSWVRSHHERLDGHGYPDGLRGEAIPLGARILTVADSWDAITAGRPYDPARPAWQALEELRRHSGRQFDPAVVTALETVLRGRD